MTLLCFAKYAIPPPSRSLGSIAVLHSGHVIESTLNILEDPVFV